jgi:hypothetical protein
MKNVHIVQCLCPQRHCICAIAYQPGERHTPETVIEKFRAQVEAAIQTKALNPWCGLAKFGKTAC